MHSAVVFAYHNVGVRCLATLLAHAVDVRLVITHAADPDETIWFDSVAGLAALHDIPTITPADANQPDIIRQIRACQPDFLFSFYYRNMLGNEILSIPQRGAYNMHGSLLPKYRGRAPVNWAVLHGESHTGASLHAMVEKPDAGALIAQQAVPILPNDSAHDVFHKVTCAAEVCLSGILPALLAGQAPHQRLNLQAGSYYGRRRPQDGRIDWQQTTWQIHNLIRAVAPPYPGAFFDIGNTRVMVLRSHYRGEKAVSATPAPRVYWHTGKCYLEGIDGERLQLLSLTLDGQPLHEAEFIQHFGSNSVTFPP